MKYNLNQYFFLDILVKINARLMNTTVDDALRIKDEATWQDIDNRIKEIFSIDNEIVDIDIIIECILNLTGYLKLIQPFYDGNNRTLSCFLKMFFALINYDIDTNINKHSTLIPIFYEEDEQCLDYHINNFKKRLTKK